MPEVICSLPWTHICLRGKSALSPCCRFLRKHHALPKIFSASELEAAMNSEEMRKIRKDILEGKQVPGCRKCDIDDEVGATSLRAHSAEEYPLLGDETPLQNLERVRTLEVFCGNTCNLRCHSCGPSLSTSWQKEFEALGWKTNFKKEIEIPDLPLLLKKLSHLEKIKLIGGEPLLWQQHLSFLDAIPPENASKIELIYYTNGTVGFSAELLNAWARFKKIDVSFSIDGVGRVNEYLRFPSKWTTVEKNLYHALEIAKERANLKIKIQPTVYALNAFEIPNLCGWIQRTREKYNHLGYSYFSYLVDPEFLCLNQLPENLKSRLYKQYSFFPELREIAEKMMIRPNESLLKELKNFVWAIDKNRGTRMRNLTPELAEFLSEFFPEHQEISSQTLNP